MTTRLNDLARSCLVCCVFAGLAAGPALADIPDNLTDIPYQSTEWGSEQLRFRGYRDGLHHQSYHNYNNTPAYSDGYGAGQRERDEQTSYRPSDGRYSGYHAYVSLEDLVGARASSADSAMRSRGFRDTGGYKQGNKSFVTWYNPNTLQCVQAVTRDGQIRRFESIDEGNCL